MQRTLENTLDFLRRLLPTPAGEEVSDAALAARWADSNDEEAFALLLHRHGPMVFGVCRRILRDEHQSEEAFQATFLVLAAKSASLRRQASVAAWLHAIAVRVASRAAQRVRRETSQRVPLEPDELPDASFGPPSDFAETLERELALLPADYRAAVLLCDVQEHSPDEACQVLGWTAGQLRGRLHRARVLLRKRLARHGWGERSLVLPTLAVPLTLQASTLHQAVLFVVGTSAVPATSLALGVLYTMRLKMTLRLASLGLFCVLLAGVLTLAMTQPQPQPQPAPEKPAPEPPPAGVAVGLFRQPSRISHAAVSPDGKVIALACADNVVRLIDLASGQELNQWQLPNAIAIVGLGMDGARVHAALGDVQWNGAGGMALPGQMGPGGPGGVMPGGGMPGRGFPGGLPLGGPGPEGSDLPHQVRSWDRTQERELPNPVALKGDPVYHGLSLDGKQILWQAPDNAIHLQNRSTEQARRLATPGLGPSGRPLSMKVAAFSDDGKFVAGVFSTLIAEGQKQSVHVWETATGTEVFYQEFRDEDDLSGRLALSPDGKHLAFSRNREVTLWSVPRKERLRTIAGVQRSNPAVLQFDRSGQILYLGQFDGVIQGHRIADGTPVEPTVRTLGDIRQILPLPDGKTLTACSNQGGRGYLRLWQPEQERDNYRLAHPDPITSLAVRPDGSEILVTTGKDVHRWSIATGKELSQKELPQRITLPRPARAMAISPDGERIVVGGDEWDHVHLLDRNGKELADWHHKGAGKVNALAFSPDGKTVASVGHLNSPRGYVAGLLTLWDVGTGKARQPIDEQRDALTDVQFAPSGKQLAATCSSGTALILEVETGKVSTHRVNTVAKTVRWLPRGDRVVLGGAGPRDNSIQTFGVAGWQKIHAMKASIPPVRSLAVRPDGDWLACGCDNGLVLIWELGSDEPRWKLSAHSGSCNCVAFLPQGKTLVTAGNDGVIRLWDVESGEERLWP